MSAPSLPPLPPRSATEIVDGAIQLIRPHFGYFMRIAAIGAIPGLIGAVISLLVGGESTPLDPAAFLKQQTQLLPLTITLLSYVFAALQSGAIIAGALAALKGDAMPTVMASFSVALRRLHAIVGVYLIMLVLVIISIIPVVVILAAFSFAGSMVTRSSGSVLGTGIAAAIIAIVVLLAIAIFGASIFGRWILMNTLVIAEGVGPFTALSRSQSLSQGHYGLLARTYGLVLLIVGVFLTATIFAVFALMDKQQLMQSVFSVVLIPIAPIIGCIGLLSYSDLRIRREGADLDAELASLDGLRPMGS